MECYRMCYFSTNTWAECKTKPYLLSGQLAHLPCRASPMNSRAFKILMGNTSHCQIRIVNGNKVIPFSIINSPMYHFHKCQHPGGSNKNKWNKFNYLDWRRWKQDGQSQGMSIFKALFD